MYLQKIQLFEESHPLHCDCEICRAHTVCSASFPDPLKDHPCFLFENVIRNRGAAAREETLRSSLVVQHAYDIKANTP